MSLLYFPHCLLHIPHNLRTHHRYHLLSLFRLLLLHCFHIQCLQYFLLRSLLSFGCWNIRLPLMLKKSIPLLKNDNFSCTFSSFPLLLFCSRINVFFYDQFIFIQIIHTSIIQCFFLRIYLFIRTSCVTFTAAQY